jgi:hypothetical protein
MRLLSRRRERRSIQEWDQEIEPVLMTGSAIFPKARAFGSQSAVDE